MGVATNLARGGVNAPDELVEIRPRGLKHDYGYYLALSDSGRRA